MCVKQNKNGLFMDFHFVNFQLMDEDKLINQESERLQTRFRSANEEKGKIKAAVEVLDEKYHSLCNDMENLNIKTANIRETR